MKPISEQYFRERFPKRERTAQKGDFGRILLYAGSPGMAGAAVLAGRAALRSGAGLVSFLLPELSDPVCSILQTAVPEATCVSKDSLGDPNRFDAIAAGSGLGQEGERKELLRRLLEEYKGKLVLDADALNLMARDPSLAELVRGSAADILLTPHAGEAGRLLNRKGPIRSEEERIRAVQQLSEGYHCTVLLKGADTLIHSPGAEILVNPTGNPGMATGGSGDVLSGILAAFMGQGLSSLEAAACGAYIHGRAGDKAAQKLGEVCMNAGDIIAFLPAAWDAGLRC